MATISFVYRPSTKSGDHPGSLILRIIHQRKVKKITTNYKVYQHEWDSQNGKLIIPIKNSSRGVSLLQIEKKMNHSILLFKQIVDSLEKQGTFTITDIAQSYSLYERRDLLSAFVSKLSDDLIATGQERTARAYKSASKKFIQFNHAKDIRLEFINSNILKAFEAHLMNQSKSPNTISFYMRNLRAIYNKAIEEKCIDPGFGNPFKNVYTGIQTTRKRALVRDDLSSLIDLNLDYDVRQDKFLRLYDAKQYFFFCFYARGMSFVDMVYLRKENIKNDIISYYRKKTGKIIEVGITLEMKKIMEYFSSQTIKSEYIFPIIQNNGKSSRLQYESALRIQNYRLKTLAKLAGINEKLTTHVARHSWATTAKLVNLPLWIISEGLGHSDEKTTYTYLASFERSVLDHANEQIHIAVNNHFNKTNNGKKK